MHWEIAPKQRMDLVAFAGLNLSGERRVVEVYTVNGRQGNVEGPDLKSCAIVGPVGTRVVFMTSEDPENWQKHPWRAVHILPGHHFLTKEGRPCVRIPDLDFLDKFDARRTEEELQTWFEFAEDLGKSKEWTYGRPGDLKQQVKAIRIDKL